MASLLSCWFIIESSIIADGFLKWFFLSFYLHPVFIFVCKVFLWLKLLLRWLVVVVFYPIRIIYSVGLCVFKLFRRYVTFIFSSNKVTHVEINSEGIGNLEIVQNYSICQHNNSDSFSSIIEPIPCKLKVLLVEDRKDVFEGDDKYFSEDDDVVLLNDEKMENQSFCVPKDMSLNEYLYSIQSSTLSTEDVDSNDQYSSSIFSLNSLPEDSCTNECETSVCSSNYPVVEREVTSGRDKDEILDEFYKKYCERMRWFDMLNYDRTCGIDSILNKNLGAPTSFESISPMDFQIPYMSWDKMAKKRLLKSIESDFELVYVAQSCLSWEALHHQYTKVSDFANSDLQNGVFYDNVAGEFQKFQVLLERFLEDERCEGKRVSNYVGRRFALQSLLQVPKVSGFFEEENEEMEGERVNAKEVLKAIEKCIEAFSVFVKADNEKPWWKFRSSLWTYPPVEDPRDIELLGDLTRRLQKKELWLKDLQGKKRCWFNRVPNVNSLEESQKRDILFTMIDMKLVSRVFQMSVVSSSQLKWCKEKLDNIEFKEGKVFRACSGPLFPPS